MSLRCDVIYFAIYRITHMIYGLPQIMSISKYHMNKDLLTNVQTKISLSPYLVITMVGMKFQ